jgi:uncharacterized lipoprotein YddW (UPF0748 family)
MTSLAYTTSQADSSRARCIQNSCWDEITHGIHYTRTMRRHALRTATRWGVSGLALLSALTASAQTITPNGNRPAITRETRAVWVATVSNIDWPTSRTLTPSQQRTQILDILDRAVQMKLNVIVLQVRPMCDALYPSQLEPWSHWLTNQQGTAPSPFYDPLQFWIDEAKRRGLELHAWFNPYRAATNKNMTFHSSHISRTRPDLVREYGDLLWLDPGEPDVQQHSLNVILDVLQRYDIDGVHFDDYFYPYPQTGIAFPDDPSYGRYLANGGTLGRADWRRENVNTFVRRVYTEIKGTKPWVKFGISPFGIWRPNNPPGITGLDSYASLYADSRKWIREGWVDYFTPQLYWRIDPPAQSYPALLDWWIEQNWQGRHLWPGNYTSNIGTSFGDWPVDEILRQIEITRSRPGSTGNVHFSWRAFRGNWKGIFDLLRNGLYAEPTLVPSSRWLDATPPSPPLLRTKRNVAAQSITFSWTAQGAEPASLWAVSLQYGDTWSHEVLPAATLSITRPLVGSGGALRSFSVSAIDRSGNESVPATRTAF